MQNVGQDMYFENVKRAVVRLFQSKSFREFIVNLDRLGNAFAGGWYWATISARVGYFVLNKKNPYWHVLRKLIDETFRPLDGANHCVQAYRWERRWQGYRRGNDVALALLSVLVIVGCIILLPIVWLYARYRPRNI